MSSSSGAANALQQYIRDLELPISIIRLESYRPISTSTDLEMVVNYLWNVALSEALFPALQGLEIALRNSISAGLSDRYGTDSWYDLPGILEPTQVAAVSRAKHAIVASNKSVTSGRVIAELNFWFWTSLLSQPYHHRFWTPQKYALIDRVFPHVSRSSRNRRKLHRRCNGIRALRNRVFHFEPIWNYPTLKQEYADILEALDWISPTLHATVLLTDRFADTYSTGQARIEALVRGHLGL